MCIRDRSNSVVVSKVDEVFMKVDCDDGLARDLYDFFSFTVPNAKFMPSYKNRYWDGKVRLFSIKTKKIYIGLLPYVDEFCRERGFDFSGIEDVIGEKQREKCSQSWLADLNLPFEPRDYQIDAFNTAILSPILTFKLSKFVSKKPPNKQKKADGHIDQ